MCINGARDRTAYGRRCVGGAGRSHGGPSGADYRDLDLESLQRRIGTVFQDFMEYDLSAADNTAVADTV
ncbi:hypothetical protein Ais01nite_74390 [Asanoa ishikariensis]|nr:hypothetical protein Ais01nite_74390 [Asanoa ishikariensis]